MVRFLFYFIFVCFVFPQKKLLSFEERTLFDYDFFQHVHYSEWSSLDSIEKNLSLETNQKIKIKFIEDQYLPLKRY